MIERRAVRVHCWSTLQLAALASELKRSPKPLAVYAATDDHALEVLETCECMNISCPIKSGSSA
jgi:DNA-binding LacI/PurR family transcriptional regulator